MRKFTLVVMLMLFAFMVFVPMAGAVEKNPEVNDISSMLAKACEAAIVVVAVVPDAPPGTVGIVASATPFKDTYMTTTCKYIDTGPGVAISATETIKFFGTKYSDGGANVYTIRYASTGVHQRPAYTLRL